MLAVVKSAFVAFTEPLEGICKYCYLDNEGFVTTGLGDLIDPLSLAITLPWLVKGTLLPATRLQIVVEWNRVKALQVHKNDGGGRGSIFERTAVLVLSEAGIATLVGQRLDTNDRYLSKSFSMFGWPADAQLGLHSMAWAQGAIIRPHFPHFSAAVDALDFQTAAGPRGDATNPIYRGEAWMKDSQPCLIDAHHPYGERVLNVGLRPRNIDNKALFQNAAVVVRDKLDVGVLHWPQQLAA